MVVIILPKTVPLVLTYSGFQSAPNQSSAMIATARASSATSLFAASMEDCVANLVKHIESKTIRNEKQHTLIEQNTQPNWSRIAWNMSKTLQIYFTMIWMKNVQLPKAIKSQRSRERREPLHYSPPNVNFNERTLETTTPLPAPTRRLNKIILSWCLMKTFFLRIPVGNSWAPRLHRCCFWPQQASQSYQMMIYYDTIYIHLPWPATTNKGNRGGHGDTREISTKQFSSNIGAEWLTSLWAPQIGLSIANCIFLSACYVCVLFQWSYLAGNIWTNRLWVKT